LGFEPNALASTICFPSSDGMPSRLYHPWCNRPLCHPSLCLSRAVVITKAQIPIHQTDDVVPASRVRGMHMEIKIGGHCACVKIEIDQEMGEIQPRLVFKN